MLENLSQVKTIIIHAQSYTSRLFLRPDIRILAQQEIVQGENLVVKVREIIFIISARLFSHEKSCTS